MKTALIQHLLAILFQFHICAAEECNGIPVEELVTRKVIVKRNPATIIEYRSTETNLHITMTSEKEAFLGIGYARNTPYMVGNDAVIGTKLSDFESTAQVRNYALQSQSSKGIVELAEQRVTNTNFVSPINFPSGATGSVMNFTKPLNDGEDAIPPSGDVEFIWAVGFGYLFWQSHAHFGRTVLTLDPCRLADGSEFEYVVLDEDEDIEGFQGGDIEDFQRAIKSHGIMAALAFGLFMPVAIAASALRKFLDFDQGGKKAWMRLHFFLNMTSFALATTLIGVVFKAKNDVGSSHLRYTHERMGLTVYVLMALQVISGFCRPSPSSQIGQPKSGDAEEVADDVVQEIESDSKVKIQKTKERVMWEFGHKSLGLVMLALILYTLKSGLDRYEIKYGEVQGRSVIYWVWFVFVFGLSLLVLHRFVRSFI